MYIKLTRLDNSPIWLNACFVVTVEPRKGGGSVVVPIGDGLDYDVKETPEAVLAMLEGAPAPAVVPVPVSDCLAPTPDDVSPVSSEPAEAPEPAALAKEKPVKKTRTKATVKKTAKSRAKAKKLEPTLGPEQIDRLRKMMPGTLKKLQNTLVAQFKVVDADSEIHALEEAGVFALEQDHVTWKKPE